MSICEICGREVEYEELIFVMDDDEDRKPEYRGYYICDDCVFDSIKD